MLDNRRMVSKNLGIKISNAISNGLGELGRHPFT